MKHNQIVIVVCLLVMIASGAAHAQDSTGQFKTGNGKTITIYGIGPFSTAQTTVTISYDGGTITVPVNIPAGKLFTYARVGQVLVIPKNPVQFETYETSFYDNENQLYVKFKEGTTNTVYLYTEKGAPLLFRSSVIGTIRNIQPKIFSVQGTSSFASGMVYWNSVQGQKDSIEDKRRVEILIQEISRAGQYRQSLQEKIKSYDALVNELENDTTTLNKTIGEGESLKAFLLEQNQTQSPTGSVALQQHTLVYWGILSMILFLVFVESIIIYERRKKISSMHGSVPITACILILLFSVIAFAGPINFQTATINGVNITDGGTLFTVIGKSVISNVQQTNVFIVEDATEIQRLQQNLQTIRISIASLDADASSKKTRINHLIDLKGEQLDELENIEKLINSLEARNNQGPFAELISGRWILQSSIFWISALLFVILMTLALMLKAQQQRVEM